MLSNTVQNVVATATWRQRFVHPCLKGTTLANFRVFSVVAYSVMSAAVISRSVLYSWSVIAVAKNSRCVSNAHISVAQC